MASAFKRPAEYVPDLPRRELDKLSKASLMELVWDYARLLAGGDSATDAAAYADIVAHAHAVAAVTGRKVLVAETLSGVAKKRLAEIDGAVARGLTPHDPAAFALYRRELLAVQHNGR